MYNSFSRRDFVKSAAITGIGLGMGAHSVRAGTSIKEPKPLIEEKGMRVLFQGDSITDGNRGRNMDPNHIMGHGYAFSIASRIGADFPERGWAFFNRGISGNTVTDLQERWTKDALELQSDLLSVLVDYPAAFDKAMERAAPEYWIWDGVHPTVAGHEIMAKAWLETVAEKFSFLKSY